MRLLIASDLHGSLESLRFLLGKARELQPDLLVLLGDLVYHGPRNPLPESYNTPTVLKEMADLNALPAPSRRCAAIATPRWTWGRGPCRPS